MSIPETTMKRFKQFAKVAEIVFFIWYNNLEQEKLFYIVEKINRFLLFSINGRHII